MTQCNKSKAQNKTEYSGFKSNNLLSINADAKTSKGEKIGYLTGILYLAPYKTIPLFNTCAMAEIADCGNACLYTAGRGKYNNVQKGRINKTNWFYADKNGFMLRLVKNIKSLVKKANKTGLIPLIRLNGTSDIKWENVGFEYKGKQYNNIMEVFPDVQFYDYTKIVNRDNIPVNYDLTFSYSGKPVFKRYIEKAINKGMRLAVVFRDKKKIPAEYMGLPVINGDNSDVRHIDPQGVIIALYAKGQAKKDYSGFVVDVE